MGRVVIREPSAAYRAWRAQTDAQTSRVLKHPGVQVGAKVSVVIGASFFQGQIWATGTIKVSKHNQLYISVPAKNNLITHKARRMDIEQNVWRLGAMHEECAS